MAADAWHRGRGADRHVFQLSRGAMCRRWPTCAPLFAFKDQAWRRIFWVSLPPGILFVMGSLLVSESPRWLFRRGRTEARTCRAAALAHREQADRRNEGNGRNRCAADKRKISPGAKVKESLLHRKYVIPFRAGLRDSFCNTATGINSIIGYNTNILLQSGLSDVEAHWGYVIFTLVNFLLTIVGMTAGRSQGPQVPADRSALPASSSRCHSSAVLFRRREKLTWIRAMRCKLGRRRTRA